MKEKILILSLFSLFLNSNLLLAQEDTFSDGGSFQYKINNAAYPCVSEALYRLIEENCNRNAKLFLHNDISRKQSLAVQLNWPVQAGAGLNDCSYYYISAHVDQDTNSGSFSDYNCGSIAYDGHKGTDIAIGPFPFHKMDSDQVKVIAAAPGIIIDKHDGEFNQQPDPSEIFRAHVPEEWRVPSVGSGTLDFIEGNWERRYVL